MVDVNQGDRFDGGKAAELEAHPKQRTLTPRKKARAEPELTHRRVLVIGPDPEPPPKNGPESGRASPDRKCLLIVSASWWLVVTPPEAAVETGPEAVDGSKMAAGQQLS